MTDTSFWDFSTGIFRGLFQAFRTDINVFLLGVLTLIGGNRATLVRTGLLYVIFRRADDYIGVIARILAQPHTVKIELSEQAQSLFHTHDD